LSVCSQLHAATTLSRGGGGGVISRISSSVTALKY
jgi:hypothetical protein